MLVIGVGNDFRCDDAIGLLIARAIHRMDLPNVTVVESTGEGTGLMRRFGSSDRVFLFDAVYSGVEAGAVHLFAAHEKPLPTESFLRSTHAFSVAEAVELARELHCLPDSLVIVGIEGEAFGYGEGLSPRLRRLLPTITEKALAIVQGSSETPRLAHQGALSERGVRS